MNRDNISVSTTGIHVIAELGGCSTKYINDLTYLDEVFLKAIELSGATLIKKVAHQFNPQGVTMVYALSESHLSIHSWPEKRYCSIDMYTCGKCDPRQAVEYIRKRLEATTSFQSVLLRGIPEPEVSPDSFYHFIIEKS